MFVWLAYKFCDGGNWRLWLKSEERSCRHVVEKLFKNDEINFFQAIAKLIG